MVIHIAPLQHEDVEGAITCIQQAFAEDPYFLWVFDRASFSVPRNRASLRSRCLWGMKHAMFHVAKDTDSDTPDAVLGVACWLPPSTPISTSTSSWFSYDAWSAWFAALDLQLAQIRTNVRFFGRGGLDVRRYWIWKAAQAVAQRELWDDPAGYYFCNIVVVSPEAQGKGIGKALMDEVLRKADAEGRKCYLESSRMVPNVAIYGRMGFGVRREMLCKDGDGDEGVMLYCMMREPRSAELTVK